MRAQPLRGREPLFAAALTVVVLLLRWALARPVGFCGTPDACYYLGTAQSLASGHGFHARFLFDLQQAHPALPNTGIEYWRPGISFLLLTLRPWGVTLGHAAVLTSLVGVIFAAAAWHIAVQGGGSRRLALAAYALCLLGPSCWIGSLSPDSGLFYGAAVAWFLALFTVRRQGLVQDLAALVCAGCAYLIRNDAALLLLPLLAVLMCRQRGAGGAGRSAEGSSLPYAAAMLLGFACALLPMHLLYHAVLGTAFPAGTARVFFFSDLSDFTHYRDPATLQTLLAPGWKHLLLERVVTLATTLYRIAALSLGYAAVIFLPLLAWKRPGAGQRPRLPELTGAAVFFLAALLVYALVLPAIGQFSALRTAEGVLPLCAVLVVLGIRQAAATPEAASWLVAAVVAANLLAGVMNDRRDVATLQHDGAHIRAEAAGLLSLGAQPGQSIVLTGDPVQFSVTTGFPAVALPGNGDAAVAQAAGDFQAEYALLDSEGSPTLLESIVRRLQPVRVLRLPAEHTIILKLSTSPAT